MSDQRRVSVVVVGCGAESRLYECLSAALACLAPEDEVILVDNGVDKLTDKVGDLVDGVTIVNDGKNLGFAGGCNVGASAARGDYLVFVNSDAFVRPGALDALVRALERPAVGLATGSLRLEAEPESINSAGNPVHFLGITWAGGYGEPAATHSRSKDVATASGAFFGVRKEVWQELGGFDPAYFMYHEDTDLSLRCWLGGRRVVFVPDAVADHDYSFARNAMKFHLLERNRLITVLTDYPSPVLRRVVPLMLVTEPLLLVLALAQGWGRQKFGGWFWVLKHREHLRERRRRVQRLAVTPRALQAVLTPRIDTTVVAAPGMTVLNGLFAAYWRVVWSDGAIRVGGKS